MSAILTPEDGSTMTVLTWVLGRRGDFTTPMVRDCLGLHERTARRAVRRLLDLGYIVEMPGRRLRPIVCWRTVTIEEELCPSP